MAGITSKFLTYTRRLSGEIDGAYAAYLAGQPNNKEHLYKALMPQARNITLYILRGLDTGTTAHDAVHRTMMALETFHGESRFSTWFFQIARNEAVRELARRIEQRDWEVSVYRVNEEGEEEEIADPKPQQDPTLQHDMDRLGQVLPEEQAEVVRLRLEGYKFREIAEKTGVPLQTAATRFRLAEDRMRAVVVGDRRDKTAS